MILYVECVRHDCAAIFLLWFVFRSGERIGRRTREEEKGEEEEEGRREEGSTARRNQKGGILLYNVNAPTNTWHTPHMQLLPGSRERWSAVVFLSQQPLSGASWPPVTSGSSFPPQPEVSPPSPPTHCDPPACYGGVNGMISEGDKEMSIMKWLCG